MSYFDAYLKLAEHNDMGRFKKRKNLRNVEYVGK